MEFFFEVDHCVVLFTIDVRPESRLRTVSLTVKLTQQYKPSLTASISGSNWFFCGFFLSGAWRYHRLDYAPFKWRVRAIRTHAT